MKILNKNNTDFNIEKKRYNYKTVILSIGVALCYILIPFIASLLLANMEKSLEFQLFGNSILLILSLLLPALILNKILFKNSESILKFKKPIKEDIFTAWTGLALMVISQIISAIINSVLQPTPPDLPLPVEFKDYIFYAINIAFIPAIIEETVFRGVFYSVFKPFGKIFSILAPAFLFSIMHANFSQIPNAFLCGVILGYIRIKTDSMLIPMVLHFLFNLSSVIAIGCMQISNTAIVIFYVIYYIFSLIGLSFLKRFLNINNKQNNEIRDINNEL